MGWSFPLKDSKSITIKIFLDKSDLKRKRVWVDKGSEFYNRSMQSEHNGTEMYVTYNERKSFVAERFIRTLKNKIYKYMIPITRKCVYQ